MPSFQVETEFLVQITNNVTVLQSWLRPGYLAYVVGEHFEALRPSAVRLQEEVANLIKEFANHYPEVIEEEDPILKTPDTKLKAGDPHPRAGDAVQSVLPGGRTFTPFRSKEARIEYTKREKELYKAVTVITVSERLTMDHIKMLSTERLDQPRTLNGVAPDQAVDFSLIMKLVAPPNVSLTGP